MKSSSSASRLAHCIQWVLAGSVMAAGLASAQLRDHGPADPTLVFPRWYRDLNGTAVGLCKSLAASPNSLAGGAPMCFALPANPAGFAGNVGDEVFYNLIDYAQRNTPFKFRYLAGLEASYLPGPTPVHGQETVFARVRIAINFNDPSFNGDYTVTHPFGVEHFSNVRATTTNSVQGGQAAVYFTVDVPLGPNDFEGALAGPVGPFLQWDTLEPGESLTAANGDQFLGDPNLPHTFTGSPFVDANGDPQNYIRVDGPPGSGIGQDIDGNPQDFFIVTRATILGQKWTAPIATDLNVTQATKARDKASGWNSIDVWANSAPNSKLILTGDNLPSMEMKEDGVLKGQYHGHVEYSVSRPVPANVTVTNVTSNPVTSKAMPLVDSVAISQASYDTATRELKVVARSSDEVERPALIVENVSGLATADAQMSASCAPPADPVLDRCFSHILSANLEPPREIRVRSAGLGGHGDALVMAVGSPQNIEYGSTVPDETFAVNSRGSTSLSFQGQTTGNDPILIIAQPTSGVIAGGNGNFTFTANANAATGGDSFKFARQNASSKAVSNVATGNLTLLFAPTAPTVGNDQYGAQLNVAKTLNVLSNDKSATTNPLDAIDPKTVQIATQPKYGSLNVNSADGSLVYTARTAGVTDSFSYKVKNIAGTLSAPAAVQITNFNSAETIRYSKMQLVSGKWTIVGNTSWFGPNLATTTVGCWLTASGGATLNPPKLITVDASPILVDTTGKFQAVPVGATPAAVNQATAACTTSNGKTQTQSVSIK